MALCDCAAVPGTANGGSALLWASMIELSYPGEGKVLTVDVTAPDWKTGEAHWGGVPTVDPTKHRLWNKYVKFIKVRGTTLGDVGWG